MQIAIIGAGKIGGNLTRLLTARGHRVAVANSRGPETLTDLARETGATPAAIEDVARDADLVIVTIPEKFIPDLPEGVLDSRRPGAPVVDTGNYYPWERDGRIADGLIAEIEAGKPESVWVSEQLGVPVVKAFNGILWTHLLERGRPHGDPERIALPVAGDDPDQVAKVVGLIDEIGFDAVYAGPLSESWRMHPSTPVYGADADAAGVRRALAAASPERPAEWTAGYGASRCSNSRRAEPLADLP